jgi:hypothetical protein
MNACYTFWKSYTNNTRRKNVFNLINKHKPYKQALNDVQPTCQYHNGTKTIIDLCISTPNLTADLNWSTYSNTLGSDHQPSKITYKEIPLITEFPPRCIKKKTNWDEFEQTCNVMFNDFELNPDINIAYSDITEKNNFSSHRNHPSFKKKQKTKE